MSDGLTRDEFFDVYREFRPDAPRDEFDREWDEFQRAKAAHLARKGLQ